MYNLRCTSRVKHVQKVWLCVLHISLSAFRDEAVHKWQTTSLWRDNSLLYVFILLCSGFCCAAFCCTSISARRTLLTWKWSTIFTKLDCKMFITVAWRSSVSVSLSFLLCLSVSLLLLRCGSYRITVQYKTSYDSVWLGIHLFHHPIVS